MNNLRIVFMGTPNFATASLQALVEKNYNVVGVITVPDKPAGRGQKLRCSSVKEYAISQNIPILQPNNLKDESFLLKLKILNPDIQVVVAFRMLPEVVWNIPKHGTFNLHASLLPKYRGAAPINWAIINGDTSSGVTTFFIEHQIDTGNIIFQEKVSIETDDDAGILHDKLMRIGSQLVCKTIDSIAEDTAPNIKQEGTATKAPKIYKDTCQIDWYKDLHTIQNHIRGLSPYPGAWTTLSNGKSLKVYKSSKEESPHEAKIGSILTDGKSHFKVAVNDGFIHLKEIQLAGKKRMAISDFLRGFEMNETLTVQ
ncbi:MAG: methionyl-tRNA formyltransferase [Flavobacteriales bacterium]|nr:methionyl-tRNA formyltransferase [Flavobacteriales bacterium]